MATHMLYAHALTPIHVGTGQGAGVIDLPIIREQVTGWPYLPGSSIKGVLRDACRESGSTPAEVTVVFGPDTENASEAAGGMIFSDMRLLCMPVRSYAGSFAWVTAPLVLSRWSRDADDPALMPPAAASALTDANILVPTADVTAAIGIDSAVRLEDREFTAIMDDTGSTSAIARRIASACFADPWWQDFFLNHVGMVSDTAFTYFTRTATEITARNRIDPERKVVEQGALWWEEALPAESLFAGPMVSTRQGIERMSGGAGALVGVVRGALHRPVQIGGNASVGRGLTTVRIPDGEVPL